MKIFFIILLVFIFKMSFAQLADCQQLQNPNYAQPPLNIYSRSVAAIPNTATKYVFSCRFHIVKNTDGTGSTANFGENEALNAVMILNTNFNQFNIFFKYIAFDVIKNSSYMKINSETGAINISPSHKTFTELVNYSKIGTSEPVYDENAMNLFIVDMLDQDMTSLQAKAAGVAYLPGVDSAFTNNYFLSSSLPHEIGHNLNLFHTHERWNTSLCEHVSGNNNLTNGDFVPDTPASYRFLDTNLTTTCGYINPTNEVDCVGVPYINCPVKNFMSTNNFSCRQLGTDLFPGNAEFTAGQGNRMRNQIAAFIDNTSNPYGYNKAQNTIESLYQPFAITGGSGSGTNGNPASCRTATVNNTNTGVNFVPITQNITFRFQKGFEWNFYAQGLAPLSQTYTNQYNFTNGSYDLNVNIPILDPVGGPQTYQQVVGLQSLSTYEPFTSGDVKSMYNLGSSNYSQEELNSLEASDPELYNTLMNNQYHIITKQTDSGYTDQKIIHKN